MRLRKKQINKKAIALAIAASVAVSAPATANAVAYDIDGGTVHVDTKDSDDGSHVVSWQDKAETYNSKENSYDHTARNDNEIKIVDDTSDLDDNPENATDSDKLNKIDVDEDSISEKSDTSTNDNTILDVKKGVEGKVSGENLEITVDLNNKNEEQKASAHIISDDNNEKTDDSAINVGDNVTNVDITVENTKIYSKASDDAVDIGQNFKGKVTLIDAEITAEKSAAMSVDKITDDSGYSVPVEIKGENILKSGSGFAGLNVKEGGSVTIREKDDDDDDNTPRGSTKNTLTATGGEGGAGIGGNSGESSGAITIESGEIEADGGKAFSGFRLFSLVKNTRAKINQAIRLCILPQGHNGPSDRSNTDVQTDAIAALHKTNAPYPWLLMIVYCI